MKHINSAPFGWPRSRLVRLVFSAGTVFFSHSNSVRTIFFNQFQPSFSKSNGASMLCTFASSSFHFIHAVFHHDTMFCSKHSCGPNLRPLFLIWAVTSIVVSYPSTEHSVDFGLPSNRLFQSPKTTGKTKKEKNGCSKPMKQPIYKTTGSTSNSFCALLL